MGVPARERPGLEIVRVFCAEDGTGGNPLGVFRDGASIPEAERQEVARELGFSETVFMDDEACGVMRIFTPELELPLAGHPLVGTAWLMREAGIEVDVLRPPAGEVQVRFDGELTYAAARPEWGPGWRFEPLDSPAAVEALHRRDQPNELVSWAWLDEEAGVVRARAFARDDGILEDQATGSAALQLTALVEREIEIRQGQGSLLLARPLGDGRTEVGGRVVRDPDAVNETAT